MLVWILLSILAASLSYAAFRGYFSAELLLGFANTFSCCRRTTGKTDQAFRLPGAPQPR
jgi:hypothetical protein